MCPMYYRVDPEPQRYEGYGFKKVNQAHLADIVERVSKTTYSSRIQSYEPQRIHNYERVTLSAPPRTPSACRRRLSIGSSSGKIGKTRAVNEQELQRLVRRVRKPTKAYEVSRRDYEPEDDYNDVTGKPPARRVMSASERRKAFDLMTRPTTASRAKNVMDCYLCDEKDADANKNLSVPFDYPYADDQSLVSREEVVSIVSRISSPTKASQRGRESCWCSTPNVEPLHYMSEELPLVSGMGRSKSVNQIVNRLHHTRGTYRKTRHGYNILATPIGDFYSNEQAPVPPHSHTHTHTHKTKG